jgi:hypothetical protein
MVASAWRACRARVCACVRACACVGVVARVARSDLVLGDMGIPWC